MFKNILNTFFTKIFIAAISFIIIVINSKALGTSGVGEISLIILSVSIYLLINEFFSGAFVYFVPRSNTYLLLIIAYAGLFVSLVPFILLYLIVPLAPVKYFYQLIGLSLIFGFSNVNQLILLGKEDIKGKNLILFVQTFIVFLSLIYFFYVVKKVSVYSYIYSLYFGYFTALILGWFKIKKYIIRNELSGISILFKKVLFLGAYNAVSNLIQKANYRLSYYLIEYFLGLGALGRFSVGVQVSESTWLVGQSVATVQYARISNTDDKERAVKLTIQLLKAVLTISFFIILFFAILPENFYQWIFGKEFTQVNFVIRALAPGIIALSGNMIFSHYFSGTGQYRINTIASIVGLIFIVVSGIILIPYYKLIGAGIAMSFSYISSTFYLLYMFIRQNKMSFNDFLIKKNDLAELKQLMKQTLSKNL